MADEQQHDAVASSSSPTVLIVCLGSRGDVQPFVALGGALRERGARVVVCVNAEFESFVRGHGLEFALQRRSLVDELRSEKGRELKRASVFRSFGLAREVFAPVIQSIAEDSAAAAAACHPTLLVGATLPHQMGLYSLAEKLRIPYVAVHTVPASPSGAFAPPTAGMGFSAPFQFLNRFAWYMGNLLGTKMMLRDAVTQMRTVFGLPPLADDVNFVDYFEAARIRTLYIYSACLVPRPVEWAPALHHVVGYLDLPEAPRAADAPSAFPAPVQEILAAAAAAGDARPVIYVGLGSMLGVMFDDEEPRIRAVVDMLVEGALPLAAAKRALFIVHAVVGRGVTVHPTRSALTAAADGVVVLHESVPHNLLFPLCAATVGHGGAGSTHAALLAGRPTLVIPCSQATDQPFWADAVARHKVGLAGPLVDALTAHKFTALLDQLLARLPEFAKNAAALAEAMRAENSLPTAAGLVLEARDVPVLP